jgi:hypothetical protein
MGIGVGVFLIAAGAILAFGVNAVVPHANLQVIGIILMVVGALGLIVSLAVLAPRRRAAAGGVVEERTYRDPGVY